jgi:hypothetical protein
LVKVASLEVQRQHVEPQATVALWREIFMGANNVGATASGKEGGTE